MKKTLSLLLSIIMLLSITACLDFSAYAVTNKTQAEAIEWCKGKVDKTVEYNDSSNYAQCVDFVQAYYNFLGKTPIYGSANTYLTDSGAVPSGWKKITVKSNTELKKGDVAVYTPKTPTWAPTKYGHVAVVAKNVSASDTELTVYQQNYCGQSYVSKNGGVPKSALSCVIRPDFKNESTPYALTIYYNINDNGYVEISLDSDYYADSSGYVCKHSNNQRVAPVWYYNEGNANGLYNASTFSLNHYGYEFKGWSTSKSGGTVFDQDDASVKPSDLNPNIVNGNCSVTLYAVYEPYVLTVKYNANGGTVESNTYSTNSSGDICIRSNGSVFKDYWKYGETHSGGLYDASTFGLKKPGYVFKAWLSYDQKTIGEIPVSISEKNENVNSWYINSSSDLGNCTTTLYAKWAECTHSYNNGIITIQPTTTSTGIKTYTCTVCGATKTETVPKLEQEITTGWQKIDGKWYFFDQNGQMLKSTWVVQGANGNERYYLASNGVMQTGWQKIDSAWYYFKSSGAMVTGWQKINGTWYYFNSVTDRSGGDMVTGWQKVGSTWYYFKSSGAMVTGWQKVGSTWYYFNSSGAMYTGWLKSGGSWYYMESSGAMLANTSRKIGGKTYKFNGSGVCTNP